MKISKQTSKNTQKIKIKVENNKSSLWLDTTPSKFFRTIPIYFFIYDLMIQSRDMKFKILSFSSTRKLKILLADIRLKAANLWKEDIMTIKHPLKEARFVSGCGQPKDCRGLKITIIVKKLRNERINMQGQGKTCPCTHLFKQLDFSLEPCVCFSILKRNFGKCLHNFSGLYL